MLERLSEQLQDQPYHPTPLYSRVVLVLVLGAVLTGWLVYDQVSYRLDQLTQKPILAMQDHQTPVKF